MVINDSGYLINLAQDLSLPNCQQSYLSQP